MKDRLESECGFGLQWGMDVMSLPCGGVAYFDEDSGISYRCESCGAVVGSIGMSRRCKEEAEKWEVQKALGGNGWDYFAKRDQL